MSDYLDIGDLPSHLRAAERAARAVATDETGYEIVLRPGWHGRQASDPPVVGVVETLEAALWFARRTHEQSGQGTMRRYAYRPFTDYGPGTWPSDAPTSDRAAAFEEAARELEARVSATKPMFII